MSYFRNIYSYELPARAKSVYMYLKDRSNKENECWPSINTIAGDLSMSRSTVKRALDDLTAKGLLVKQARYRGNGGKTSNLYVLNDS